jgi:hypothetical protein
MREGTAASETAEAADAATLVETRHAPDAISAIADDLDMLELTAVVAAPLRII